jgi:hypothetical protein
MSFSPDIPLSYSSYTLEDVEAINELIQGDRKDPNFKVIPPIIPLGQPLKSNIGIEKQNGIDVLNHNTNAPFATAAFVPEIVNKQQIVIETDNKNMSNGIYVLLDEDKKYRLNDDLSKSENTRMDYENMEFIANNKTNLSTTFYIGSLTVLGLFIVYRMIQKSK